MTDPDRRPDPDALLQAVHDSDRRAARGRLKVFVGAAPGVGKTFAMLEAARLRRREGTDVVVGIVETHGREETARMLEGFEVLPRARVEHRGTTVEEFDLGGALARKPTLLLVDELAHTNAPTSAHAKRWQDIETLRTAGIEVYSTVNVQHLESLNDVVAGITGVQVRETIPDAVLDGADEIELVDVSPEVLEQRLREGKVYAGAQAERALDRFFRRGNLIALRELALRRTAERVDAQMRGWRASAGIDEAWAASECVVAYVGPTPSATRCVRAARRLAGQLKAPWFAVYVEQPADATRRVEDREAVQDALRLAEELGGRAVSLTGLDVVEEVLAFAGKQNATRILVGRSRGGVARVFPGTAISNRLVARAPSIDVTVVAEREERPEGVRGPVPHLSTRPWREYFAALAWVLATTLGGLLVRARVAEIDMAMAFLLAVVICATRYGRGPALASTIAAVLAFDVLFVPPYGTLAVSDTRYALTFVVMFVVGAVMSGLTRRVREQAAAARQREQRTATLLALSRDLAAARDEGEVAAAVLRHVHDVLGGRLAWFEQAADGEVHVVASRPVGAWPGETEVAQWCAEHGKPAGAGTRTLPGARGLYVPFGAGDRPLGVLGVLPAEEGATLNTNDRQLLDAMTGQGAVALDRARQAHRARTAHLEAEAEKLRNALLSSLSHDLRTPLGSVEGAASVLLREDALSAPQQRDLATTILEESQRMTRLVGNLLDMVRVETGALHVQRDWHVIEEVIGEAVLRIEDRLGDRVLTTHIASGLPLVSFDDVLIQQVLVNLLENALRHTPAGSAIDVSAEVKGRELVVSVADRGPGIARHDAERIFEKFQRGDTSASGIGLGLSICWGIIRAHGGRIWVDPRDGGGAAFRFALPMIDPPPSMDREDEATA